MKPRITIAEVKTPDGGNLVLEQHDRDYYVRLSGETLMSTRSTVSERFLAEVVARRLASKLEARVLIGGLGFGFTARELLDRTDRRVKVEISELFQEVIDWNRDYLKEFNGNILEQSRVKVVCEDVSDAIGQPGKGGAFDAILLDVDNGASPLVQKRNSRLYSMRGLHRIACALNERGHIAVWSASPDLSFFRRMEQAGFTVEEIPVRAHERARRSAHVVYLGRKNGSARGPEPRSEPNPDSRPDSRPGSRPERRGK